MFKLCAWLLSDFDRVLVLDADIILLKNMDRLFMSETPFAALRDLPNQLYTWGANFILSSCAFTLRPSVLVYSDMIQTARTHHIDEDGNLLNSYWSGDRHWEHIPSYMVLLTSFLEIPTFNRQTVCPCLNYICVSVFLYGL